MRPLRTLTTALLIAGLAVGGCARSQPNDTATNASGPAVVTATPATIAPAPADTTPQPVVLADGRHPVLLKSVDPNRRTIRFDLIQLYFGEEARREELRDHDTRYPAPNDVYLRNVNPRLRTLPVRAGAPISILDNDFAATDGYVSLAKLAAVLPRQSSMPFWITVRNGQVVKLSEQYIP
ncbi:MAG TPA: hypothetical protein VFN05_10395 [Actinomycetes bacterium]|nr:hypothetical protein [Actinomycetes bacterium]